MRPTQQLALVKASAAAAAIASAFTMAHRAPGGRAGALVTCGAAAVLLDKERGRYGRAALRLFIRVAIGARLLLQDDDEGLPMPTAPGSRRPSAALRAFNSVISGGPVGSYSLRLWRLGMATGVWGDVGADFDGHTRGMVATLGGVRGRWFGFPGAGWGRSSPQVLYLHGGGYTAGAPSHYASFCTEVSRMTDARVFAAAYRLGPEHSLPAAVDDAYDAYAEMVRLGRGRSAGKVAGSGNGRCGGLVVMGDSAGGGLLVLLLQRINAVGELPQPTAAVAMSPLLDLRGTSVSHTANMGRDQLFRMEEAFGKNVMLAVGGDEAKLSDPACNAMLAPPAAWVGLPPIWLLAGESELLRDDAIAGAAKARAGGARVRLSIVPHVPHVWPIFTNLFPEARETLAEIAAFIRDEVRAHAAAGGGGDGSNSSTVAAVQATAARAAPAPALVCRM